MFSTEQEPQRIQVTSMFFIWAKLSKYVSAGFGSRQDFLDLALGSKPGHNNRSSTWLKLRSARSQGLCALAS